MPAWCFEDKLTHTTAGFICFTFVWGYMAGVNGLAGHELIHRKEATNKAIGMFTFSKILYSHFLLEHSSGHHRNVATPEDSATARKGEIFFSFTLRSAIGGHVNTWNREMQRL
jgi:alkane 1-monooxygenase